MKRGAQVVVITVLAVAAYAMSMAACTFQFNYDSIEAPLGTTGEIGIRVIKTHNRCTLTSMEEYRIAGIRVQILGRTPWAEVRRNTYETLVQVSLSETGEGALVISKTCSKSGYEEGVLPVRVTPATGDGNWMAASSGVYPFDVEAGFALEAVTGLLAWRDGEVTLGNLTFPVPRNVSPSTAHAEEGTLFLAVADGVRRPLLAVGPSLFVRLDALVGS